jgi:ferritin
MFELIINGEVYQFNFGMGFMRAINKKITQPVDDLKDVKQNIGLRYKVLCLVSRDVEELVDVLVTANMGQNPRVTPALLDAYIDNPETDIEQLFKDVLDFLRNANATKNATVAVMEEVEKQKARQNHK